MLPALTLALLISLLGAEVYRRKAPQRALDLPNERSSHSQPIPRGGGLPNGVQLIGRPFSEAQLFAVGQAYQREVPPEIARRLKG